MRVQDGIEQFGYCWSRSSIHLNVKCGNLCRKIHNPSELDWLSGGYPTGLFVDSCNAFVFTTWLLYLTKTAYSTPNTQFLHILNFAILIIFNSVFPLQHFVFLPIGLFGHLFKALIPTWCHYYPDCKVNDYWCSRDAPFHNSVTKVSEWGSDCIASVFLNKCC